MFILFQAARETAFRMVGLQETILTPAWYTYIIRAARRVAGFGEGNGAMQKKLTLTIDEEVYAGLREVVGPRKISHFVEDLVRPHVIKRDLYAAYRTMSADRVRESEALEWAEASGKALSQ